jgi:integrase
VLKSDVVNNGLGALLSSIKKEEAMDNNLTVVDLGGQTFKVHLTPQTGRPRSKKTVADIFEVYKRSDRYKEQSDSLKESESRYFRLHIIPFMGKLFSVDVAGVMQSYIVHREKSGAKPNTLTLETRALSKAIQEDNPAWQKPRLRYSNEAKRTNLSFSVKDLLPVLEEVKRSSSRYGLEYFKVGMVAAFTSMRLKDVVDLTNDSLDRRNWKITFVQSKVKNILKAQKSFRTSEPVVIDVCDTLKDIFRQIPETKKGKLFDVRTTKAVTTAFLRAFKRAGVSGSFHTFRHACATTMLAKGANVKVVQDILGHANLSTTMKYLHALDTDKKSAINSLMG